MWECNRYNEHHKNRETMTTPKCIGNVPHTKLVKNSLHMNHAHIDFYTITLHYITLYHYKN
jgi:hypothetical protein